MFCSPTSPLDQADLKSLLAHLAHPQTSESSLSPADFRNAQQWAIAANLVTEQGLTPEGQLVANKDPYLETTVTDWLIHFHLSRHGLWRYFVYEFLPNQKPFKQDELFTHCLKIFKTESPDTLKKSLRLVLKTYTESPAIVKSGFLKQQNKTYLTGYSDLSNPYTTGYILAKIWEHEFKTRSSILVDEIIESETPLNQVLGIDKESLLQQLDILAEQEIIEQRSAKPHLIGTKPIKREAHESAYQVYCCWNSSIDLLEKAYENDIATPNRPLIQSLGDILDDDEDIPDFSQLLKWVSRLTAFDGGSNTMIKLAS